MMRNPFRFTDPLWRNPLVSSGFPLQKASNAEISICVLNNPPQCKISVLSISQSVYIHFLVSREQITWWRHQMETFSALLAICAGNSPVTGEFPGQRPVPRSFDGFCDLRLNKRLSNQLWGWWFGTPLRPLWRHCNVNLTTAMWKFSNPEIQETANHMRTADCCLVRTYGIKDPGRHWYRQWLVAWRHQVITWTNVYSGVPDRDYPCLR